MALTAALGKLSLHVRERAGEEDEHGLTEDELQRYALRLNRSLQTLQKEVDKHEALFKKSNEHTSPLEESSTDTRERLKQIRTTTAAYKSLTAEDPPLPSAESPLPALLAVRCTLKLIDQSKLTIRDTYRKLERARKELGREGQSLKDAQYLASSLETHLNKFRLDEIEQSKKQLHEIASGLALEQQQRKTRYAREMRALVRGLNRFVNDQLALMLAAEDLGGPVVGDVLDLDKNSLKAGFTQQGRAKKLPSESEGFEKRRRARNASIWGDADGNEAEEDPRDETEAAAAAFRDLTESLLNTAAEGDDMDHYIHIQKENAAVRFLVRANVAQFHPEDAGRLRLLSFGTRFGG